MTTPSFEIAEGTVPEVTVTRKPEENPFTDRFPTKEGAALVVNLPNPKAEGDENDKALRKVVSLARRAAEAKGYTARVKRSEGSQKGTTDLTIWTVDRITRPRKNKGK